MPRRSKDADEILKEAAEAQVAEAEAAIQLKLTQANAKINHLRRLVKEQALQNGIQADQIATFEALHTTPLTTIPKHLKKRVKRKRKTDALPVAVVMCSSDWHTHELVDLPENKHDPDIGRKRAWTWFERQASMLDYLTKRSNVVDVFWGWLGDFMTNSQMPHYDATMQVGLSPQDEAIGCRDLLVEITHAFLDRFPDLRFHVVTAWGNHERSTPKMEPGIAKDYTHSRIIYGDAARWFADTDRITFNVATDEVTITDIHGFKLATHHGHLVKFSDAIGGISTALNKLLLKLMKQGIHFDALMIGHWHRAGMEAGMRGFTNGSLVGINRYAKNLSLGDEPPAQIMLTIDLERLCVADFHRIWGT